MKPFCDLLAAKDEKTVCVVLDGVTNILSTAEKLGEVDKVAMMVEECGGLDRVEALQTHENESIYRKSLQIIETFFPSDDQVKLWINLVEIFNSKLPPRLMRTLRPRRVMPGSSSPQRRTLHLKPDLIFRKFVRNTKLAGPVL